MTLLSRLAAQAMGEPPAVRPVIAPRFQASRVGGVDRGAPVGTLLEQETTGGMEAAAPSTPPPRVSPRTLVHEPGAAPVEDAGIDPAVAEPSTSRAGPIVARETNPAPAPPRLVDHAASADAIQYDPIVHVESIATRASSRAAKRIAKSIDGEPVQALAAVTTPPPHDGSAAAPPPLVAPRPADFSAAIERVQSAARSAAGPPARRDPIVRVTIGRIEVRSAPPAAESAPEPVPRPAAPPLPPRQTLADYLAHSRDRR